MGIFRGTHHPEEFFLSIRRAEAVYSQPAAHSPLLSTQSVTLHPSAFPSPKPCWHLPSTVIYSLILFAFEDLGFLHIHFHFGMAQRHNNKHMCLVCCGYPEFPDAPLEFSFGGSKDTEGKSQWGGEMLIMVLIK